MSPNRLLKRLRSSLAAILRRISELKSIWSPSAAVTAVGTIAAMIAAYAAVDLLLKQTARWDDAENSVRTIASVCSAAAAYKMPSVTTQDDIYHLTYKTISERFQYYLQDMSTMVGRKEFGIIVDDHRGSKGDARLRRYHQMILHSSAEFTSRYDNLIESLFLEPSNLSVGIQLADMVAGAVWRKYERGDDKWYSVVEPSLRRSRSGRLLGYGIVKVPKYGWT